MVVVDTRGAGSQSQMLRGEVVSIVLTVVCCGRMWPRSGLEHDSGPETVGLLVGRPDIP